MTCPQCSAIVAPGAEFCGVCGRRIEAPKASRMSTFDRATLWQLRAAAALLVVLFLEVVAGVAQIGPEHNAHRAQKRLAATAQELAGARTDLAGKVKERDDLKARADKLQVDLDDSKKSTAFQTSQAATFKECLTAIKVEADAPNSTPQNALIDMLKRVDKACTAADRLL
jgi:uncharacterized membrane-anchored protein YjiN (DUF445 family)